MGSVVGPSVTANAPGTYIVRQQLAVGCDPYAIDTVEIAFDGSCVPMENPLTVFKGSLKEKNLSFTGPLLFIQTFSISNCNEA